jgi:hypothetical protein
MAMENSSSPFQTATRDQLLATVIAFPTSTSSRTGSIMFWWLSLDVPFVKIEFSYSVTGKLE